MAYRKYKAQKTKIDGITFDSKKEAEFYLVLKQRVKDGEISNLTRQESFLLIPSQWEYIPRYNKAGERLKDEKKCIERSVTYRADFCWIDNSTGERIVCDVKGIRTPEYRIKKKLMLQNYGIRIYEV